MKTAILIHGMPDKEEFFSRDDPSCSNAHWFPWMQQELLIVGYEAQTPEMPAPYHPIYNDWKRTFEQFHLTTDSILIGHSCGAGFLLRYFSENKISVKRIVFVAPYLDPEGTQDPELFNFEIDPDIQNRTDLHMFYSDNDMDNIHKSVEIINNKIPGIQTHKFEGYGHFCYHDMETEEFPELRDIALKD